MTPRITATHFYQYLKCPSWIYWDRFGNPAERKELSAFQKMIMEGGLAHEKAVIATKKFESVEIEDLDEAALKTVELMKKGTNIYQGVLLDKNWVGRPDYLEARKGPSKLGEHYYVAFDIKSSHELKDVYKFQLTFYALLLERLQGVRPEYGYIINADHEVLEFSIDEFLDEFHLTLKKIEAILAGAKPPPFLAGDCKESPWFGKCVSEAESCNDISLIYKIWRKEAERLRAAGITTVKALASVDLDTVDEQVTGISRSRLERLQLQARALSEGRYFIVEPPALPEAATEVYFDVESDPTRDIYYLFGLLTVKNGASKYHKILAEQPEDEAAAWKEFQNFIAKLKNAVIYHYGWYERQVIKHLADRHGISGRVEEKLNEMLVDLNKVAQKFVVFPIYFYSLKDIAKKCLGFKWRHKEASGANSILWYDQWLKTGNRKILQDIIDYNEDDVRATKVLKDWLASQ